MRTTLNSDKFAQILRDLARHLGLNQAQMAARFRVPQGTLSKWLSGAQQPRLFDAYPLIEEYRELVSDEPAQIRAQPRVSTPPSYVGTIPEIDVHAGAGGGGLVAPDYDHNGNSIGGEAVRDRWTLPQTVVSGLLRSAPEHIRAFEVEGDSMLPTLQPGDRVFVDTRRREPNPEGVFVLYDGGAVVVKSLQIIRGTDPLRIRVISDNTKYPAYDILAEESNIIGRYVGRFTTR